MRAVACASLALLAGCNGGGEERLPAISLRGRLNLPSAAARAGVIDATFGDADGEQLHVETGERTTLSVRKELPFLSEADAASLRRVRRLQLDVLRLELGMPATLETRLELDGVPLSPGRVELPPGAVSTVLEVGVEVSCPLARVEEIPNGVELDVLLQPVVVP